MNCIFISYKNYLLENFRCNIYPSIYKIYLDYTDVAALPIN